MPDNRNKNQNQGQQGQGGMKQGGQQQKPGTKIENEDMQQVGNDNDQDRDLESDESEITQRNPRVDDQGQQQGGQGGDRKR